MSRFSAKVWFSLAILLALCGGFVVQANAQKTRTTGNTQRQMRDLLQRIRVNSDNFRASFDAAIQNIRLRGTEANNIHRYIEDYETALNNVEDRLNNRTDSAEDVKQILDAAARINGWLRTTRLTNQVERDWTTVKSSLNQLAREYNLNWNGDTYSSTSNYPNKYPSGNSGYYNSRLTGTYRLDNARSDNPHDIADRAVANLPSNQRDNARAMLEQRLDTPDGLAIQQNGKQITIASTRAPRYTFDADGRDKNETGDNGAILRVRASLIGDRLEVMTSGDRGNDYSVTFEPYDNGRSLRVTRRLSTDFLTQPVIVSSIYEKTEQTARLDIYENPNNFPNNNNSNTRAGDFVVANNTTLRATLNETLSTKTANNNDRFTLTVQTPDQFRGAIIEGYISNVQRSGKMSGRAGMNFNFETIRLRDGKTYDFAGFVESIRNLNGEEIKIGNEGSVQGESQTKQTATRGAIGAGIGAIIGAIAGGGKGAAIGAIIGGGAGAGSVYIEGRDDLEINSGSDVYIRASAPTRQNR